MSVGLLRHGFTGDFRDGDFELEGPQGDAKVSAPVASRISKVFSDRSLSGRGVGNPVDILNRCSQPVIARSGGAMLQ